MNEITVTDREDLGTMIGGQPITSRLLVIFSVVDLKQILKYYTNTGKLKVEGLVPYLSNDCWGVLFYCIDVECSKNGSECAKCFLKSWKENREVEVFGIRGS